MLLILSPFLWISYFLLYPLVKLLDAFNLSKSKLFIRSKTDILNARRLSDETVTLDELSKKHKISRERIRQIETKAFEKLQKEMLNAAKSKNLLPKN